MSTTTTTEAFDAALDKVFEGRECQFGPGPRKLLREFYDLAREDERSQAPAVVGAKVQSFSDLRVGTVFSNDYLLGEGRARKVTRVISDSEVLTDLVSTRSGRVVTQGERYDQNKFDGYAPYKVVADPTRR
jgi:hypothetical protein